jgi:prepilin-type processing-associated H-X9-DG protein
MVGWKERLAFPLPGRPEQYGGGGGGQGGGSIWGNSNPWWRAAFCLPEIGEGAFQQWEGPYRDRWRFPPDERGYDCGKCRCLPPQAVRWNEGCEVRRAHLYHSGNIMNVALADGSVRSVSTSISTRTWQLVCDPRDGMVPGNDW